MSKFSTPGQLCAWAGVAPASHESAGKRRPAGTRQGSTWLQRTIIESARAAASTKGSYSSAQYSRIARRRGTNKATVAVAHSILNVAWHLLTNGVVYDDPGARYFELRHDAAVEAKRLQRRIEALGFEVTLRGISRSGGGYHISPQQSIASSCPLRHSCGMNNAPDNRRYQRSTRRS